MLIKTIFNRLSKFKGFVVQAVNFCGDELEIVLRSRRNSEGRCSECGIPGSCYDHRPERRFEFVPLWGIRVFLVYAPRRINCVGCGPTVEQLPWCTGRRRITTMYQCFLAHWARKLSWKEVAVEFRTTWQHVFRAVAMVVEYGLLHRDLSGITAVGVDEIQWSTKKGFLTVVYQIDQHCRRLLWVSKGRTVRGLLGFFRLLGKQRALALQCICSDMWRPYIKVIAKKAPHALHILDRFHIVSNVNKALDEVRADEAKKISRKGYEPLKCSRWCFLKRPENLTSNQKVKLQDLLRMNLRTVRAYLLAQQLHCFWEYNHPTWAGKFLDAWCRTAMRSKIEPMKKIARSLRKHRHLILNWFRAKKLFSSGIVEGFNNKAKVTLRKAYGFRTFSAMEIALFHQLGELPEPEITHTYW
jgi:transposase